MERLAELTAEDAGETVNADADESQHQEQSADQSAAEDAACGYEAWLLPLHPGQNRFRITLPDQQAQLQQQQYTFAGGRAGNGSSGVGTDGSEYSLTVVRLADPSNAELQSITGKQRPRERGNGTCHKHLTCTASTRCYPCSVTPGPLACPCILMLLHCDLYSAAAKLSGESLALCGPPAEDGSRLRAALDCDATVQLPPCTRPCKPGGLVRQAGFADITTVTFVGHDSPMACILALNQMRGHCTAEGHACSLRHISFVFAGVPLVLNVSDASAVVSLTPALKHPDVDGIRVEVNGQVHTVLLRCSVPRCTRCCRVAQCPGVPGHFVGLVARPQGCRPLRLHSQSLPWCQ